VVSHDRAFLDNVVTSLLAFEGEGKIREVVGGYADWLKIRAQENTPANRGSAEVKAKEPEPAAKPAPAPMPKVKAKLSFKDQREFDQLPALIDSLESEQIKLTTQSSEAAFFQNDAASIKAVLDRLVAIGAELETAYARWAELDG